MAQPCFQNQIAQTVHKYANFVLTALVAVLAWWGSNIDARLISVAQEQARRTTRVEEVTVLRNDLISLRIQLSDYKVVDATLKRHEDILRRLEDKINVLFERSRNFP